MKTLKTYHNFVMRIKECTNSQYVMMKSEMCQNKKLCDEKRQWVSRLMFKSVSVNTKKKCSCKGKHSYDCGNEYCAVDKNTCQIMFKEKMFPEIVKEIKPCV